MPAGDEQLIARAIAGDQDAASELLERFGPQVRQRIRGGISPQWQSVLTEDDIMQVTYLEAFLEIRQFDPHGGGTFLAWLTRIAENNIRDAARELGRAKRPPPALRVETPRYEDTSVALLEMLGVTTTTPSRVAQRAEVSRAVEAALDRLPADYSRVIRLYDLEGRPVKEVAAAMGRSAGAVFMLRGRAHGQLRKLLGSETEFFSRPG